MVRPMCWVRTGLRKKKRCATVGVIGLWGVYSTDYLLFWSDFLKGNVEYVIVHLSYDSEARNSDGVCVCRERRSSSSSSPPPPTCLCTSGGDHRQITAKCSLLTRWTSVINVLWSKDRLCSSHQVRAALGSWIYSWTGYRRTFNRITDTV